MPTFPVAVSPVSICVFTPMTWPRLLISGPPELPWLMGASVWMTWSMVKRLGAVIRRCRALTIPAVTVRSSPNGFPIATTGSPTRTSVGVTEWERSERARGRVHAEHCKIRRRVAADDFGLDRVAVGEADRDLVRALDDVVVGDDVPRLVDDEAGAEG